MKIDFCQMGSHARLASSDWRGTRFREVRRAAAAVEMAMVAPLLMTLLLGLWEVGRYVMMQDELDNAARESARLAASGGYFSSNNHNSATTSGDTITLSSPPSTNSDYEIQKKIKLYLQAAGVTTTGMTITITNTGSSTSPNSWSYTWTDDGTTNGSGTGSGYDPSAAANQLDQLSATVTLPYKNVAYSPLSQFISQQATMSASASWLSLTDIPLTVSTTIPTQPIGATDPIP